MGERFRLVFAGDVIDGHRIDQVQRELAELLHLNEARQQSLFSGKRTVLRRGLGFEAATRHALKFERLGAKVLIEPEPESESPAKAPPKVRRKPRSPHRKVWLASSSVVVMAALAGTGWFLWGWDSPAAPQVSDERLAAYQLSPKAREVLLTEYWPAGGNKAFAASTGGAWGHVKGAASDQDATQRALADCESRRAPGTAGCRLINITGQWVPVAPPINPPATAPDSAR
jgi:hypothetical protein